MLYLDHHKATKTNLNQKSMAKIFAIFPLITAFFDYFENICIFIMLKAYPEITNLVVDFGSSFSLYIHL